MVREDERRAVAAAAAAGGGRGNAREKGGRGGGESGRETSSQNQRQYRNEDGGNEADTGIALEGSGISAEEFNALVAEMVRFMLFKNHQQHSVPVKREELAQLGCKKYKQRFLVGLVIKESQNRLQKIFGMEMKELVRVRQPTLARGKGASQAVMEVKTYIIRTTVPEELHMKYVDVPEASIVSSLALIVMGIIHLAGDNISEDKLWLHLQRLGIKEHDEGHPIFGSVKQLMELIAKQRYIQKERSEGEGFVFKLAERALDDAVKSKLDTFINKIAKSEASGSTTPYTPGCNSSSYLSLVY